MVKLTSFGATRPVLFEHIRPLGLSLCFILMSTIINFRPLAQRFCCTNDFKTSGLPDKSLTIIQDIDNQAHGTV